MRAVLECAGIHDVLSKSLGSDNAINIVHATVAALKGLERPEAVAARRGLPLEHVAPARCSAPGWAGAPKAAPPEGRCVMASLKVTQIRSEIGGKRNHRETLRTLGLKRIGHIVVKEDRPEFRGMVRSVPTW